MGLEDFPEREMGLSRGDGTSLHCWLNSKAPPVTLSWRMASLLPQPQAINLSHTGYPHLPICLMVSSFLISLLSFVLNSPLSLWLPFLRHHHLTLIWTVAAALMGLCLHLASTHSSSMPPGRSYILVLYLNHPVSPNYHED